VTSRPDNLRRSVDACLTALRGKKKIDLFQAARVDPKIPVEQTMETMKSLVSEGKFDYIGISECSADTLKRAAKVATITAVEIEISPLSYEDETKKGE
jgi:pyridoxine 4-dehydrogenase